MSTIAATSSAVIQRPISATPAAANPAPAPSFPRPDPVDVVSISEEARSAAANTKGQGAVAGGTSGADAPAAALAGSQTLTEALPLVSASPGYVDDMMNNVSGSNGFVWIYNNTDWAAMEAKFGKEITERNRADSLYIARVSQQLIMEANQGTGIPLRMVPTGPGPDALAAIKVEDFAFEAGGSRYEVRAGEGGLTVGTKDGQGWKGWHMRPPVLGDQGGISSTSNMSGSLVALQTLTNLAGTLGDRSGSTSLA